MASDEAGFGCNRSLTSNSVPNCAQPHGVQLCTPTSKPQCIVPANQTSVSPPMYEKPRLEIQKENSLPSHFLQQMSHRQAVQLQNYNDGAISTKTLPQQPSQTPPQQQIVSNISGPNDHTLHPHHLLKHAKQKQLPLNAMNGAMCSRRVMSYIHHIRQRPADNNIGYWRRFVDCYYAPGAKRRLCFSKFDVGSHQALGVSSLTTAEDWKCELCGSAPANGLVQTHEVLARMNQLYWNSSGVVDELLFLDIPWEIKLPSGLMMLYYGKAVQESIYNQSRVLHEGKLRIIFTQELKIMSWDFCIESHEELIPRRLVAAQFNELLKNVARCNADSNGNDGTHRQDLQSNMNRIAAEGTKLAKMADSPLVNNIGFPKPFVRNLKIAEVVHCMKDLMAWSTNNITGPKEALNRCHQEFANAKLPMRLVEGGSQTRRTRGPDNSICASHDARLTGKFFHIIQPTNYMAQAPSCRDQSMFHSPSRNHEHPVEEPVVSVRYQGSYISSIQNPSSSAPGSFGASSREEPTLDPGKLLALTRTQNTKRARTENPGRKWNGACYPNFEDEHVSKTHCEEDMLSLLPDELLILILSLVPIRSAVATSVLSRRWRHLWTYVTHLYFDPNFYLPPSLRRLYFPKPDKLVTNMEKIFRQLTSPKINSFHLKYCCTVRDENRPMLSSYLSSWICQLCARHVEDVCVQLPYSFSAPACLFQCGSLVNLRIEGGVSIKTVGDEDVAFHLPRLKNLELCLCDHDRNLMRTLFKSCPLLESLDLLMLLEEDGHFLEISALELKVLSLRFRRTPKDSQVVINAPKLQQIWCIGGLALFDFVTPPTALRVAELSLPRSLSDADNCWSFRNMASVESLYLSNKFLRLFAKLGKDSQNSKDALSESFPNLIELNTNSIGELDEMNWRVALPASLLRRLRRIEVGVSKGNEDEIKCVEYLVGEAVGLNQLVVNTYSCVAAQKLCEALLFVPKRHLLGCPINISGVCMSSPTCGVQIICKKSVHIMSKLDQANGI